MKRARKDMINREGVIEVLKRMRRDCRNANKICWNCSSSPICPKDNHPPIPYHWTEREIEEIVK